MITDTYEFMFIPEPSGDIITDIRNKHLVKRQDDRNDQLLFLGTRVDIRNHPSQIPRLEYFPLGNIPIQIDLKEDFLGFLE